MNDIMVDIETLGTQPGYKVISVGLCTFTFPQKQSIEELLKNTKRVDINIENQDLLGLKTDPDTQKWWEEQEEAWQMTISGQATSLPLKEALIKLNRVWSVSERIWTFGYMDIAMINMLYTFVNMKQGIYYRKHRDMRTIASFCDKEWPTRPKNLVSHDASHDAVYQAYVLQRIIE